MVIKGQSNSVIIIIHIEEELEDEVNNFIFTSCQSHRDDQLCHNQMKEEEEEEEEEGGGGGGGGGGEEEEEDREIG